MKTRILVAVLALAFGSLLSAQEIRRPTADASLSSNISNCVAGTISGIPTSFPNAYDAGTPPTATSSAATVTSGFSGTYVTKSRAFTTWSAASGGYSSLAVKVNLSCTLGGYAQGDCGASYSLDAGSTWTTMASVAGAGQATYSASIPAGTNLASNLRVAVCADGAGDGVSVSSTAAVTVWDVWTEGVLAAPSRRRVQVIATE